MTRSVAGDAVIAFLTCLAGRAPSETHISRVYIGADTVWKQKKAVRLGFLDFSALEARKRFLDRELALNAPHVPGLYRDVVAVTRGPDGLVLGGESEVLDWVLRMAPAPADAFMDVMAAQGRLGAALWPGLADAVAAMHAAQPLVPEVDLPGAMATVVAGNVEAARKAGIDAAMLAAWVPQVTASLALAAPLLAARSPLVRRAHGDLHLGNLLMWQGRPAPFDALEFDEGLATIDPGYDLAFLLMDLDLQVGRAAANAVLNRYVARTGDAGLVGPLAPFLSIRAMIRAHVEATRGRAWRHLAQAALDHLRPAAPCVVAIGGLMGTGKSTLARGLAPVLGAAPGALVLRSDEVRKRLFGVGPEDTLPKDAYVPEAHLRTEAALRDGVMQAASHHSVIADATWLDPAARGRVGAAARAAGVRFEGVWLDAPLDVLERRVAARRGDASDADLAVLREAAATVRRPADWTCIDATDAGAALRQVQMLLGLL